MTRTTGYALRIQGDRPIDPVANLVGQPWNRYRLYRLDRSTLKSTIDGEFVLPNAGILHLALTYAILARAVVASTGPDTG